MTIPMTRRSHAEPLLRPAALVSGTLPVRDLDASQEFYTEVLGLEVRRVSADRMVVRIGFDHVYEVEETDAPEKMPLLSHNGVFARGDIVAAHARLVELKERYGIRKLTKPGLGHGTFGFYMNDRDGNWWEVNRAIDGIPEDHMVDLSDGPAMTSEEARKRFQPEGDILQDAIDAFVARTRDLPLDKPSILQTTCISHGTLESNDLQESRRFYEEVLGLQVKQLTPASFMVGLNTEHRYAVVAAPQSNPNMMFGLRNRLLFDTEDELGKAWETLRTLVGGDVIEISDVERRDDGRVVFLMRDLDRNWWELYFDPQGPPIRLFR
jgi:catechol 2,3-dioxygenase-like lactoylglutathione lyase family enzyme